MINISNQPGNILPDKTQIQLCRDNAPQYCRKYAKRDILNNRASRFFRQYRTKIVPPVIKRVLCRQREKSTPRALPSGAAYVVLSR